MTLCSVDRQPADQHEVLCHTVDAGSPRPKPQQSSSLGKKKKKSPTPVVSALIMQYRLIEMVFVDSITLQYQLVTLTSLLGFWSAWC